MSAIKTALATALSLALVGGGGATLAQSATVPQGHAAYVVLTGIEADLSPEPTVLQGQVPCDPGVLAQVVSWFTNQPACRHDGYAYAYPAGALAPWNATILWANDSYYVDDAGTTWHVSQIVYRSLASTSEGAQPLVRALATELQPTTAGAGDGHYALPVDETLLDQDRGPLVVGLGPQPPVTPAAGA